VVLYKRPFDVDGDSKLETGEYEASYEEYILTANGDHANSAANWELLGDASSYAMKDVTITAGDGLTGGGDISQNRTISHAKTTAADPSAVKVGKDEFGHVTFGSEIEINEPAAGKHTHTVTSSIEKNKVVTAITPSTTNISVSTENDTFVKSYPGVTSNLNTTSITGVSGTTEASKVSDGVTVDIAKVGDAVTYGTADCDTAVSGIAKVGSQIIYGNANVGTAVNVTAYSATTPAYTADYIEADECLTLTALGFETIIPAASSSNTAYVCADGTGVSITPAKAGTKTLTPAVSNGQITGSYTIGSVDVPVAATAITVATGTLATDGAGASVLTGLGDATTASALTSASLASGTATGTSVVTDVTPTKDAVSEISGTAAENGEHTHGTAIK
jgi:hypothetical protein